MSVLVGSVAG